VYLFMDVAALVALFWLWIVSGFGLRIRDEPSIARHYKVFGWFLHVVVKSAAFTFKLTIIESEGPQEVNHNAQGYVVLSRHAGPGDSFLLASSLSNNLGLRPRVVLKDTLQFDPAIDVLINRLPSRFIRTKNRVAADELEALGQLAQDMGPRDTVLIFPEGGNFTSDRQARSVAYLQRVERPDLAERAKQMTHLLAPRAAGTERILASAQGADVLVVGHTGLEEFSTMKEIWRGLPIDKEIQSRWWLICAENIPDETDAQELWLYDRWEEVNQWIDEQGAS